MILYVLQAFDYYHETCFFEGVKNTDITIHETEVDRLLDKLAIPTDQRADIVDCPVLKTIGRLVS